MKKIHGGIAVVDPIPVELGSLSPIYRALYIPGGCLGFLPSTVIYSTKLGIFVGFSSR